MLLVEGLKQPAALKLCAVFSNDRSEAETREAPFESNRYSGWRGVSAGAKKRRSHVVYVSKVGIPLVKEITTVEEKVEQYYNICDFRFYVGNHVKI